MRNPANRKVYNSEQEPTLMFNRGYTGHEHLPLFGLINMNARLYSPLIGRFLSPDPYVQLPDFTQNYNRYSYAYNNPMKFVDPNGEWIWFAIGFLVGAYIGGSAANGWDWNPGDWDYSNPLTYCGIFGGGIAGAFTFGSAFGAGGWLAAGGKGLNISIGLNVGNWATAVGNFAIEAGAIAFEGLGYTTLAGGGLLLTTYDWSQPEKNAVAAINQARSKHPPKVNLNGSPEQVIDGVNAWGEYYGWNTATTQRDEDGKLYSIDDIFTGFDQNWSVGNTYGETMDKAYYPSNDAAFKITFIDHNYINNVNLRKNTQVYMIRVKYSGGNPSIYFISPERSYNLNGQTNPWGTRVVGINLYKNKRIRNHWRRYNEKN